MGLPSQYFVDPAINANGGAGTDVDPWTRVGGIDVVQNGINQILAGPTQDLVNGDQVNLIEGTDDTTTAVLNLAGYVPAADLPLIVRGCRRNAYSLPVANNGGIGGMDGANGGWAIYDGNAGATDYVHFIDLHLHNTGAANILSLRNFSTVIACELDTNTVRAMYGGIYTVVANCHFHDNGGNALELGGQANAVGNFITNGALSCIFMQGNISRAERNILVTGGVGTAGVIVSNPNVSLVGNSILSTVAGTSAGILFDNVGHHTCQLRDNLIEGFSGAGGAPIDFFNLTQHVLLYVNNSFFGNMNPLAIQAGDINYEMGNEELAASPFLKEGATTFANRFNWFKPSIPVRGRAFPDGCRFDRGAVQVRLVVERQVPEQSIIIIPARTAFDPI